MTHSLKDNRFSGASSLHGDIEALLKVDAANRQTFVHNRLMSAIDAICNEHKSGGSAVFSQRQMLVIKDVAYHIVYLLDPLNKPQKGFMHGVKVQFQEAPPITRIGWVVGTILFIIPAISGTYQGISSAAAYIRSVHLVKATVP